MNEQEIFEAYRQSPYYEFDRRMNHKNVFVIGVCTKNASEYYWSHFNGEPLF